MTKLETYLKEVKARCDAATPGSWLVRKEYANRYKVCVKRPGFAEQVVAVIYQDHGMSEFRHNSNFIAHARTDVEVLRGMVDKLLYEVGMIAGDSGHQHCFKKLESLIPGGEK